MHFRSLRKTIYRLVILLDNLLCCCGSLTISYSKLQYGYRLDRRMIDSFTDYSILDCVEECLRRKRCKSISYYQGAHYCEINYESRNTSSLMYVQDAGWIYSDIEDWDNELIGPCSNANCTENEKCDQLSFQEFKCILTDCGVPTDKNVSFSMVDRWDGIGIYRGIHLKCAENYNQTGSQLFVCQSNGKWKSDLICEKVCPQDWIEFEGHCYFKGEDVSWHYAKEVCESEDAYLVEVNEEKENDFLKETFLQIINSSPCIDDFSCPAWIGANDLETDRLILWSRDKNSLLYTNWYPYEPNGYLGKEHCVQLLRSGFWNDANCDAKIPYICEKLL
ncbi:lymphocyte antigen 75-like [Saccostrea echinata]|uniref:lymphocyte antigen 75-like n=1 Tax=Saccostrea echinata TaxID=191078 RepID=UPI002A7F1AC3|nr:lymphocyte antigen 75-like [Saccostrea echinata]